MEIRELKRAVLREEYMAITDSNIIEALILNQLIYWSQRIYDFDKFIKEEKQRFETSDKKVEIDLRNGWIYKSTDELKNELMLKETTKTIQRYINNLENRNFIDKRRNPRIRYDRTYQYRVNIFNIVTALNKNNYTLQNYKIDFYEINSKPLIKEKRQIFQDNNPKHTLEEKNFPTKGKNVPSSGKYVATIPKTISNIITKNISTTSTSKKNNLIDNNTLNSTKKDDVGVDFLKNISSVFYDLTKRYPNSKDLNVIRSTLNHDLSVPISMEYKQKIIADTLFRIHNDFKTKNPDDSIKSFKYFLNPIIDEFKKYENLKKETKYNEQSKSRKANNETFVDEYGSRINFSKFASNR
ncbi:MAG: hypothetical protein ABF289_17790 [Clostridiales bacterium]